MKSIDSFMNFQELTLKFVLKTALIVDFWTIKNDQEWVVKFDDILSLYLIFMRSWVRKVWMKYEQRQNICN